MKTSTSATTLVVLAAVANAQIPASAPACVSSCFAIKISEATSLAPGATSIPGYCKSANFVQAFANCLSDNCPSTADVTLGVSLGQQVCAASGVALQTTGLTGAASSYAAALSTIPLSSVPTGGNSVVTSSGKRKEVYKRTGVILTFSSQSQQLRQSLAQAGQEGSSAAGGAAAGGVSNSSGASGASSASGASGSGASSSASSGATSAASGSGSNTVGGAAGAAASTATGVVGSALGRGTSAAGAATSAVGGAVSSATSFRIASGSLLFAVLGAAAIFVI
ncbi:hypothetical protein P7C70_g922, partial [Phenoliferia sp. Uapishka_3]